MFVVFCFADVESTVLDNKKYIEETNEMMESSTKKIAKIISDISAIHKGKNKWFHACLCCTISACLDNFGSEFGISVFICLHLIFLLYFYKVLVF